MNRIKIDVKQASEFMTLGYEVECYVLMTKAKATKALHKHYAPIIAADANLMLSLEKEGPSKGAYQVTWNRLKKKLWINGDISETHTRSEIEEAITQIAPDTDPGFFTYLVNNKQCLRVVD